MGGWIKLDSRTNASIMRHRRKLMSQPKKIIRLGALFASGVIAFARLANAAEENPVLTHASDVISLSVEQASASLRVSVTGVVTVADAALKGRFFVQDATGGVFVDNAGGQRPEPGDVLEISGITHAGAYAPIITSPQVKKVGKAPLPPAKGVPIERLMSGAEDSQRVEVSGVVRSARLDGERLIVDMVSGGYRFRVYAPSSIAKDPQKLVASQVVARGTAAEAHNRSLRQLIAVELYVPTLADFVVEKSEAEDPFLQPLVPLNALAEYRRENSLVERVHVKGAVTLQRAGQIVFLRDDTGGLQIKSSQPGTFTPGEIIEAVGFAAFDGFLPVLEDAVFKPTKETYVNVAPQPASIEQLQNGLHHADWVTMSGKLMDRTIRDTQAKNNEPLNSRITLVLQTENVVYTAEAEGSEARAVLAAIPIGSTVKVAGVCLKDIDNEGKMTAFRLLIGNPRDVVVIRKPSWLTPQRLLTGVASLSVVLVVIMSWTIMVSRKNSVLKFFIQEREKSQLELQRAHDLLEDRVKERTEQLKFEITARKEAEVQFKGVLAERTRLAQELHDTLEQTLTGIGLQLDTAAKLFERDAQGANRHLELSRNMLRQSQIELRRSVWDLRSRALEQFDFAEALRRSGRQMTEGTGVKFEVQTAGNAKSLPEVVEENLLRIGQEAVTNIVKHSGATQARLTLEFGAEKFILQVTDNGSGFAAENGSGPRNGHFGILGMSERAKRIGGQVSVTSAPGEGTTVRVEIPADRQVVHPTNGKPDNISTA